MLVEWSRSAYRADLPSAAEAASVASLAAVFVMPSPVKRPIADSEVQEKSFGIEPPVWSLPE